MSLFQNYYQLLGVTEEATLFEIKEIYKKLCLIYHPDKNNNNPAATEKFRQIQEAYDTLVDPEKRFKYNKQIITNPIQINVEVTLEEMMHGCEKTLEIERQLVENYKVFRSKKKFDITIKKGIKAGSTYTYSGEGDCDIGKKPGDVIMTLVEKPHANFYRDGNNLVCIYPFSILQAQQYESCYLIKVQTLSIHGFYMTIPVGFNELKSNLTKKFPGLGFPCSRDPSIRGDLVVHIQIQNDW